MAINPSNITDFNRNEADLQELLLFAIAVAGKRAEQTKASLDYFLAPRRRTETPFMYIQRLDRGWRLGSSLMDAKLSPYGTRERGFREAASLRVDLRTVTVGQLETIHGVGPKTSRFFLVHSRPDARHAVLDVHILAWLREQGYDTPLQTPSQNPKRYRECEQFFLAECSARGMSPAQLDLMIWNERSRR